MSPQDLQSYQKFATDLAREAGDIMRQYFLKPERTWKHDATPLTIADTTINSLVIKRVNDAFPEHSVYGEEESSLKDSEFLWVTDPVDGTLPYSHGLPISTFSLALVVEGVSTVGVVYDPFMDRMFTGVLGGGAFCNDEPMHVSNAGLTNGILDLEGFSHKDGSDRASGITNSIRDELTKKGAKTLQLWSSILPSALVAKGELVAVIMNGRTIQDGAAIKVIVEEAGGKVTDIFGEGQRYDEPARGWIASNGVVHDELVNLIKEMTK